MRIRTLLVAGALLGALVVAPGTAGAEDPQPVYLEGITFGDFTRMNHTDPLTLGGPAEPSVKVDSAGTIYTAGVCCVVRAAPAWYSQDGGKTFADLPSPAGVREHGVGAEGDFVVDDADGLYFSDTWVPSIFLTRWSGHGDVWEYTNDTVTVLPGVDDRPWLAYAYGTLYMYVNHVTHIQVWRSTDGGHTWHDSFNTIPSGQRYWTGHVSADRRDGTAYLFGRCTNSSQFMCAAVSTNDGASWTEKGQIVQMPRGSLAPFMVASDVDAGGNVYGVYSDINNSGCDVYLAVSSDKGETWRQFKVNPQSGCSTFPWVAAGDDGRVAVTWYHNPSNNHQNSVPGSSEWKVRAAVITDATSDTPIVTHGLHDKVIHRGGLQRDLWDYQMIAVGPDGRFHIAYAEDALAPCVGPGLAGYAHKCTTWVAQDGGPRAIEHAADQTAVSAVVEADGGSIEVSGETAFGRAEPVQVISDAAGEALPYLDIRGVELVRTGALADELVVQMDLEELPEIVEGLGTYTVDLKHGGKTWQLRLQPQPWDVRLCQGEACQRVRGDADAGGNRVVARIPLALLEASPGTTFDPVTAATLSTVVAGPAGGVTIDTASGTGYTVPGAAVTVTVEDGDGNVVSSGPATLTDDLSGFSAAVQDLAPGTYTVRVEACFADNCALVTDSVSVG